jgi:uncharacterized protein (DUF1800 family)
MSRPLILVALWMTGVVTAQPAPTFDATQARHLLNRAGFGGSPEECARLASLGRSSAVDFLLQAPSSEETAGLPAFDAKAVARPSRTQMRDMAPEAMDDEERQQAMRRLIATYRRNDLQQLNGYREWWFERMVVTPAPLEERMVLFWHGYFTSGQRDVRNSYHMIQQNRLFREHALGNFRTLLHAVAKDPAMLEYLDNNKNRKGRPNENFAREVMELFTLGVGRYGEQDIKEAARAFTGWTSRDGVFAFNRRQHDAGQKTVLGVTGPLDGKGVLDILLKQDAAPRHVARRILSHFLGTEPDAGLVDRYARLLRRHDWEIAPFLRTLFLDPAFYAPEVQGARILGPVEFLVGVSRRLGERPPGALLASAAAALGQTLFEPPNVKGWEEGTAWISTSTFLARGNFAGYLVEGVNPLRIRRDFMPPARPSDEEERGMAQRPRGGAPRELRGMGRIRYAPKAQLQDLVVAERTTAGVVDRLADHLLAVAITDEARQSLIQYLDALVASESGEISGPPEEQMLKRVARLILSLPEAQIS